MTYSIPHFFRRLSAALLFSTALGATAFAQSLPEIPPETIAQDVERRHNPHTGEVEHVAQSFDPFEGDESLAGSAALRSAGEAVTIEGDIIRGGAFLDISTLYTTNSADPYDVRGFEDAEFTSGLPVGVVRYDSRTLDCSRDVREVTYDDGYYHGASYGYIAGIYRLYPRYRGHRHYGWRRGYGHHRGYGHWRRRGHRDYGSYRDRNRDARGDRNRRDRDGARRRGPRDADRMETGRPRDMMTDGDFRRRKDRNADGDRRRREPREGRNADRRRNVNGGVHSMPAQETFGDSRSRRPRNADGRTRDRNRQNANRDRRSRQPVTQDNNVNHKRPVKGDVFVPRRRAKDARRTVKSPQNHTPPKHFNRDDSRSVSRPAVSRPPKQRVERKPPPQPRVDRKVDRTFKKHNPRVNRHKHRNFYPMVGGYTRTDVYVNARCVKEETLSLHIPQERLDAARFDGFAVILLDRAGREVPVFVPPNYVEGFRKAVGKPSYTRPTPYRSAPVTPSVRVPSSSREPIIYGDPGTPAPSGYPQN